MTVPANPWDRTTPVRPSLDDFHGAVKEDDTVPPDPTTQPNAAEYNELCWLHAAIGQVVPNAKLDVAGGVSPTILQARSPASAVTAGTFTATRNGAGDVSLTWPAGTFPATLGRAQASLNSASGGTIAATDITNGVRVRTWDLSGTPADRDFTVSVF